MVHSIAVAVEYPIYEVRVYLVADSDDLLGEDAVGLRKALLSPCRMNVSKLPFTLLFERKAFDMGGDQLVLKELGEAVEHFRRVGDPMWAIFE